MIYFGFVRNKLRFNFDLICSFEWMNKQVLQTKELLANMAGSVPVIGDIWSEFINALYMDTNAYGVHAIK